MQLRTNVLGLKTLFTVPQLNKAIAKFVNYKFHEMKLKLKQVIGSYSLINNCARIQH